jgi:hypothetical protein
VSVRAGSECSRLWVQANAEDDMATIRNWITTGLAIMGMRYASLNHDCDADVHDLVGNKNEAESEGRACYDRGVHEVGCASLIYIWIGHILKNERYVANLLICES